MADEIIASEESQSTPVQPFVLPRLDWYDEEGRIYKDALIENFNAIERRLQELGDLGESIIGSSGLPDTSDVHLDDVTMEDLPNKILNLKSYLDVVDMVNYPFECVFNGKKLVKLSYYNSNYEFKTITNKTLSVNNSNKYVYFNYNTNNVAASSSTTSPANSLLIGVYADGAIRGLESMEYANINVLYYLARMSEDIYSYHVDKDTRDARPHGWIEKGVNEYGRCVEADNTDTGTAYWNNIVVRDVGRY